MTVLDAYGISEYYDTIVADVKAMRHVRKTVKSKTLYLRQQSETEENEILNDNLFRLAAEGNVVN